MWTLQTSTCENVALVSDAPTPPPPFFSAARVIKQLILPAQYEDVVGDDLINLAVVLEDTASQECVLASEEFNIPSSQLTIQVNTLVKVTVVEWCFIVPLPQILLP